MNYTEDPESHEVSLVDGTGDLDDNGGWQYLITVGEAIDRGRKLRDVKPKKYIPYPGGSEMMEIDFVPPPCIPRRKYKRKTRNWENKQSNIKKPKKISKEKADSAPCSVRVAELAVPSKRACVENWKNNFNVLPPFMIERLKKCATGQTPMVQIKDAYGSFKKRKKSKPLRHKTKNSLKKADDKLDLEQLQKECKSGIQYLCAFFGHKIIQKLMKPRNVGQCHQLGYLYNTVAEEIHFIMRPVKVKKSEAEEYNKFHDELSKTIAIWIRLVLRDTCDKILEEQLKELEEEEGPVLDFLDALLDNALNKCAPVQQSVETDEQMLDSDQSETITINTHDFCVQEIVKVLENILEGDTHPLSNPSNHYELFTDSDHQKPANVSNDDDIADPNETVNDNVDFFEDADSEQIDYDEDNENVSVIRLPSRDDVDYENKSTQNKFSNNVNRGDTGVERISSRPSFLNIGNKKPQYLSWASDTTLPKTISTAPNAELLREVNERWPENLSPKTLVKTVSLIKSVISLGNIREVDDIKEVDDSRDRDDSRETDEISLLEIMGSTTSLKGSIESQEVNQSTSKQFYRKYGKSAGASHNVKHDVGTLPVSELDKEHKSVNTIGKVSDNVAIQTKENVSKDEDTQRKDVPLDRKTSITDLHGYLDKKLSVTDLCHGYLSKNTIPMGHGDLNYTDPTESTEKVTREVLFDNDSVESKINLKVDMRSAPSWLKWYEEECKRGSLSQQVAREWCDDLLYTVMSMEEVNNWIQKTSQSILRIKHRKELKRCCPLKCKQRIKDMADLENIYLTSTYYENNTKHLKTLLVNHRSKYLHNKRMGENWTCNCRKFLKNLKK